MQNVLIVIHLLIVIALVGVVLLQRSEGGGLGMGSGGGGGVGGFMTGRGQAGAAAGRGRNSAVSTPRAQSERLAKPQRVSSWRMVSVGTMVRRAGPWKCLSQA